MPTYIEGRMIVKPGTRFGIVVSRTNALVTEPLLAGGLRPYLDRLSIAERQSFLTEYALRIHAEYTPDLSGTVVLKYPRIFVLLER